MEQDVARALADIRYQLVQLRNALGASTPDEAGSIITRLVTEVESLGTGQDALVTAVAALSAWAQTVTPPFSPPG